MNETITDPIEQRRVLAEFTLKQEAHRQRVAQIRGARFGPTWTWVGLAMVVWSQVALGWLVDLSSVTGRIVLFAPSVAMCFLGFVMTRSLARARERLFLAIIEQEAPESYRRLQEEKIIPTDRR